MCAPPTVEPFQLLTPNEVSSQDFLVGHVFPLHLLIEELVSTEAYLSALAVTKKQGIGEGRADFGRGCRFRHAISIWRHPSTTQGWKRLGVGCLQMK